MTNRNGIRRSALLAAATMALTLLVAAACGPSGTTPPPTDGDTAVQVTVDGPGRVVQGSFECGDDCTWRGDGDAPVSFEAVPDPGYVFVAWGGTCPEVLGDTCTATFGDGDEVTATFARHALRLDLTGDGEGVFRISGGGVDARCEGDCGIALDRSLQLAITHDPNGSTGTTLEPWTGACEGAPLANYCLASVTGATDVGKTWLHPPVASSDGYTTWRNTPMTRDVDEGVLANDSDSPGDTLTAVLDGNVSDGTLDLRSDGSFDYAPNDGFVGQDDFTYLAVDELGNEDLATVTITVGDRAPAAADDAYETTRGAPLAVPSPGVLANDADPDGDALTATVVDEPTGGTLLLAADGGFTYAPDPEFAGEDTFTYQADDSETTSNVATVTITVTNRTPITVDDTYTTHHTETLNVDAESGVLANDSDPDGDDLTATAVVAAPSHGTLTLQLDGSFAYVPDGDFAGEDSFSYEASDGIDVSPPTTVTIALENEAPTAVDDAYTTEQGVALTVPGAAGPGVLGNDTDPDGDDLTASLVDGPDDGLVTLQSDGGFTYTPPPAFVGPATFTYSASDGAAADGATVTVTVVEPDEVLSVSIDGGNRTLTEGDAAITLTATVDVTGDASTDVTWSSSAPGVATIGETTGLLTPVAAGTTTITATSVDDASQDDTIIVTVEEADAVLSVTIDGGDFDLEEGASTVLAATVETTGAASQDVTWSTSDGAVATVDAGTGEVTATGAAGETANITATSVDDASQDDTVTVTIVADTPFVAATPSATAGPFVRDQDPGGPGGP